MVDNLLEPSYDEMTQMGRAAVDLIADFVAHLPEASSNGIDSDIGAICAAMSAPPPAGPSDFTVLLKQVSLAASAAMESGSPRDFGYIPSGGLYTSALAEFVSRALNRYTGLPGFAPAMIALEQGVLHWLCQQFGLASDVEDGDISGGVILTGGSLATLTALVAARSIHLGERIAQGTLYITAATHYSVNKAARIAGIPAAGVRVVPMTSDLRMDVNAARRMIEYDRAHGYQPFMLVATAGSTDTGTIDPLAALGNLAAEQGLWYHVDGAYGAGFQLTQRGKQRLAGIEKADSIIFDPHKSWSFPFGTGILLVRDINTLRDTYQATGPYLSGQEGLGYVPNFSALGPELTREYRGLRVWLPLHLHGVEAFQADLNEKLDLTEYAYNDLAQDLRLEVPWTPDLSTVAFRLRTGDQHEFLRRIDAMHTVHLTGTSINGVDMLRLCILSHRTHRTHVEQALRAIHSAAQAMS